MSSKETVKYVQVGEKYTQYIIRRKAWSSTEQYFVADFFNALAKLQPHQHEMIQNIELELTDKTTLVIVSLWTNDDDQLKNWTLDL